MEVLKDISQLTKGCGVTFIKNDKCPFLRVPYGTP